MLPAIFAVYFSGPRKKYKYKARIPDYAVRPTIIEAVDVCSDVHSVLEYTGYI